MSASLRVAILAVVAVLLGMAAGTIRAADATVASGTVTTKADGLSVPGATVSIVGTDLTAVTDTARRA